MNFKQIISLVLTLIILSTVVCIPYTAATDKMPDLLIGDADGDGVITIMDATAVALHLAKKFQLDEIHQQTAKTDFTTDVLSVIDATIIQQKVADIKNKDTGEVGLPAFKYIKGEYVPALQEYQKALDTFIEKYNISGVAYVTRNGRVMCQSATGMQNTEKDIDMTMDTLFPIGSISKQFCATAVLMLQDQGKLSVNDTIDKYFPEYEYASQITIHHLLSMRSGIYDYLDDNPDAVELFGNTTDIRKSILDWIFAEELESEPDEYWDYSNSNFYLLSDIVEQVSGVKYTDFIQTYILDELSMTNTGFYDDIAFDENVAERVIPQGVEYAPWVPGLSRGAGDLVSNAYDMDKWLTALGDGDLLSEESYKMMTTNYSGTFNYGYGLQVENKNRYWHGGDIDTYESVDLIYAKDNLNIFMVTNDLYGVWDQGIQMHQLAKQLAVKIK